MIYLIINQSHEWGDFVNETIDFVTTSLDYANEIWNKFYLDTSQLDNTKWYYSYELREYPNNYHKYSLENSKFTVLKHIDNIGE